jgi:hypothetical protein
MFAAVPACSKNINAGTEVCSENQYRCEGAVLKRCNPGRTGFDVSRTCEANTTCTESTGQCLDATGKDPGADAGTCVLDDPNSKFDNCKLAP